MYSLLHEIIVIIHPFFPIMLSRVMNWFKQKGKEKKRKKILFIAFKERKVNPTSLKTHLQWCE